MPHKCKPCFHLAQGILWVSAIGNMGVGLAILGKVLTTSGQNCRLPDGTPCVDFEMSVGGFFYGGLLLGLSLLMLFFAWRDKRSGILPVWLGIAGLWFLLGSGLNYGFIVNVALLVGWAIFGLFSR